MKFLASATRIKILSTFGLVGMMMVLGVGCAGSDLGVALKDFGQSGLLSTTVDLSGTELTSVPMSFFERTDLTVLNVSNNQLTGSLPSQLGQLQELEVLDASDNLMTGLPAEIGQLRHLKTLNLANNKLTGLPMELGQLTALEFLDLRGNPISPQDLAQISVKLTSSTSILVD